MYAHTPISKEVGRVINVPRPSGLSASRLYTPYHSRVGKASAFRLPDDNFRHWMTTCQSPPPTSPFPAAAAQGLAHTFSTSQHLHCEGKIFHSYQAQTSKKPLQSLSHLTGYCNNDWRLTLAKIRSSCPFVGLTSHRGAPYSFLASRTFFLNQSSASLMACIGVRRIFPYIHYSVFIITECYLQFCHPFSQYFDLSATLHHQT